MIESRIVAMTFEFDFESPGHLVEVQILIQGVCCGGVRGWEWSWESALLTCSQIMLVLLWPQSSEGPGATQVALIRSISLYGAATSFPWRCGLCLWKVFLWENKPHMHGAYLIILIIQTCHRPLQGNPSSASLPPLPMAPQSVKLFSEFELKPFQTYF